MDSVTIPIRKGNFLQGGAPSVLSWFMDPMSSRYICQSCIVNLQSYKPISELWAMGHYRTLYPLEMEVFHGKSTIDGAFSVAMLNSIEFPSGCWADSWTNTENESSRTLRRRRAIGFSKIWRDTSWILKERPTEKPLQLMECEKKNQGFLQKVREPTHEEGYSMEREKSLRVQKVWPKRRLLSWELRLRSTRESWEDA